MSNYIGIAENINILERSFFRKEDYCMLLNGENQNYKSVQCFAKKMKRNDVSIEIARSIQELNAKQFDPSFNHVVVCYFSIPESFSQPKVHLLEYKKDFRARVQVNMKRGGGQIGKITFPIPESIEPVKISNIVMAEPNMIITPAKPVSAPPAVPPPAVAPVVSQSISTPEAVSEVEAKPVAPEPIKELKD